MTEEISLQDYFNVIRKKKKFIILVVCAATITSAVASFLSKSTYEVSFTLKIGIIEKQLIMTAPETKELLISNRLLENTINSLGLNISIKELRKGIDVQEIPSAPELLKVIIMGESAEDLIKIAETLFAFVLEEHQENGKIEVERILLVRRIEAKMQYRQQLEQQRQQLEQQSQQLELKRLQRKLEQKINKEHMKLLKNLIKDVESNIKLMKEKLGQMPPEKYISYLLEIDRQRMNLIQYQRDYLRLSQVDKIGDVLMDKVFPKIYSKEISLEPTTIFDPVSRSEQPVKKPRVFLNILLAGIAGFIGGVILSLLGEYVRNGSQ